MNVATLTVALSLSASASLLVGCSAPANQHPAPPAQPVTQATPPPSGPPVSINAEMVAVVDHAGHALWDVEREGKAPKTEDDWAVAEEHATQLAAAGSLITLPGTRFGVPKLMPAGASTGMQARITDWRSAPGATLSQLVTAPR